jgi:predicted chitinase
VAQQQEQPSQVEAWVYPFSLTNPGAQPAPEDYLRALSASEDGFYPLGANGLWHGGIHFGQDTAGKFDQDHGVKCIADGEVVAYRINAKIQELTYPGGIKAGYSSGFALVRHRLVLPKPPRPPASAPNTAPAQNATPPAEDILTFFSLYMHTLPLDGYGASKTLPSYYGATDIYTVGAKAKDPRKTAAGHEDHAQLGLRVRASHAAGSAIVGWLPRGTKVEIGERHGSWGKITKFVLGALQPYQEDHALPANAATAWIFLGELDKESKPSAVDKIQVLPKPHKIVAGETVAYIGEYQRFIEARTHHTLPPKAGERPLLHVEVFTGDDINAFISRSRARAQQLDPKSRNLLLISKGAKLAQPSSPDLPIPQGASVKDAPGSPSSGPWRKVLLTNATGQPTSDQPLWIARDEPHRNDARSAWSQFPLSVQSAGGAAAAWTRVVSTASAQRCVEAQGKTWYAVSIADENNAQVDGWVCDHGHPQVELKSPWDWPGFEVVSLQTSVSDMFERALFIADSGTPDEIAKFENSFNNARSDETIRKLEDVIDAQEQRDGKITARELQVALSKPWLADRIDHLIVRYESEWGGEMSKWDALDSHMHAGLPVWKAEKTRIDALRFWQGTAGITPASANVYHLHPVGLVGNFHRNGFQFTLAMMQHIFPSASVATLQAAMAELNAHIELFKLDKPLRREHFMAQIRREAGPSLAVHDGESLNYPPDRLRLKFSYFQAHPDESELYGRTADHPADQEAIANRAYANRNGNGDIASGDGWKYRGRGLIQITGRTQYQHFTEWHRQNSSGWPDEANLDFLNDYTLVGEVKYAVRSAAAYWINNRMYETADQGATEGDVDNITRAINPGLFKHRPGQPINPENMSDIVDRRSNFASIHNWEGLK